MNTLNDSESMKFFEKLFHEGELEKVIDELVNDERLPMFPSDKHFNDKQWDALCAEIPMTQELFDSCLEVCDRVEDGIQFQRIIEQFPEFEVKYPDEVREKYKQQHDKYKAEYLERFGEDAILFND